MFNYRATKGCHACGSGMAYRYHDYLMCKDSLFHREIYTWSKPKSNAWTERKWAKRNVPYKQWRIHYER